MLEMQRIMGGNSMWATARERWKSVIPRILARVEVEVLHNSCLSHVMLEAKVLKVCHAVQLKLFF